MVGTIDGDAEKLGRNELEGAVDGVFELGPPHRLQVFLQNFAP
jgi:hypothetical protein